MMVLDLSGAWRYETDPGDSGLARGLQGGALAGAGFALPGSASENRVGTPFDAGAHTFREIIRAPHERYETVGPLWLSREIDVPQAFAGQDAELYLERVNVSSRVFVDGQPCGRESLGLSAPHVHALRGLAPGRHTLTLRLDNRDLITGGGWASGYSIDTQGMWIGVAGRIELRAKPRLRIERMDVFPDAAGIDVHVIACSGIHTPQTLLEGSLMLQAVAPDGTALPEIAVPVTLFTSRQRITCRYDIDNPVLWSEFAPALYTLHARLTLDGEQDEHRCTFGLRTIAVQGKQMVLNGRPIALRGTIDCAQFPLTGYPPTDRETWLSRMRTIKSCGLNHVRFHAWCPPEAAFAAADETGMMLQVEMPLWLNNDIGLPELGDDPIHRSFYTQEAAAIVKAYGNHPSFLFFSCGNETLGDFELLDDLIRGLRATDSRRLYTLTSNFDHPVGESEDFFTAFEYHKLPIRIQHLHDRVAQATDVDFAQAVSACPVPVVTFEVGQYCFTPDVSIIEDYTGAIQPCNFEWIRARMEASGVLHRLPEYMAASGDLAVKLYKEDIEAALRTRGLGGIQLLSLCDYTGQSTAIVGVLDVMLRSKGVCTPEEFAAFFGPVVPLMKAGRIFTPEETLEADLMLYDFGQTPIAQPVYEVEITCGGEPFFAAQTRETHISVPLAAVTRSCRLDVRVTVSGHANRWQVYVFAKDDEPAVSVLRTPQALARAAEDGGRHIALASCFEGATPGSFIPVFWSPVHFPSEKPCGMMIDAAHPALASFPTQAYPDYQWQALLDASMNLPLPEGARAIMEAVPNFADCTPRSPLFELRVGRAQVLVCGFDWEMDTPAARQLRASLAKYME